MSTHLREAVRSNIIKKFFIFNKSLFRFHNRNISSGASSKARHKRCIPCSISYSGWKHRSRFSHLPALTVWEMLTLLLKLIRSKTVQEFESLEGQGVLQWISPEWARSHPSQLTVLPLWKRGGHFPHQCSSLVSAKSHGCFRFCCHRKWLGGQGGQTQSIHQPCQLPCEQRESSPKGWAGVAEHLPGITNQFPATAWDFRSSCFSCKLLKLQVITICLKLWYCTMDPSATPLSPHPAPKWKGWNLCSCINYFLI